MDSLDQFALGKLAGLAGAGLRRELVPTDRAAAPWVERDGRRLLSFSCNDYLGLSTHPAVVAAAIAATRRYGAGAGASRLVSGNHPVFAALEARLAAAKGMADCCLFGSGYLANIGTIPALVGPGDLLLVDALAHACLWAGARLSGARVEMFRHNDATHAQALLGQWRGDHRHAMIATETVFSMDGDCAPVAALADLATRQNAWLLTDDAHGFGVLPDAAGAGAALRMGTLSKALGSYGGYVCASAPVVALLRNRARSFVYSTGLPAAPVAAALAALDVLQAEPERGRAARRKAEDFTLALGLPPASSTIVPVVLGRAEAALAASSALAAQGFLVAAIRPPTVPAGTARLRVAFCALHQDSDVARLAAAMRDFLPR